VDGKCRI